MALLMRLLLVAWFGLGTTSCLYEDTCVHGGSRGSDGRCPSAGSSDGGMDAAADGGCAFTAEEYAGRVESACVDPSDMTTLVRTDLGDGSQTIIDLGTTCFDSCADGTLACVIDCLQEGTEDGLSVSCATCVVSTLRCAVDDCLSACQTGTAADCRSCQCDTKATGCDNCTDVFTACSGLDTSPVCGG